MVFIPTLYYIPRGPTLKEDVPLNSEGPVDALPTPPAAPQPLHRLSFRHMQGNTLGSNVVRPFVAVQGRLHPRVEKDDHADR